MQNGLGRLLEEVWHLFPLWYWAVVFLVGSAWTVVTGLVRPEIRKALPLLITTLIALTALTVITYFSFPDTVISGVVRDADHSHVGVPDAIIVVTSLRSGVERKTRSDENGKWSVRYPRRHLGPVDVKATHVSHDYLPWADTYPDLRPSHFFFILLRPRVPEYVIKFYSPARYVYFPHHLEVLAVFEREDDAETVHLPRPKKNVELRIDGKTREYKEKDKASTDRVSFKEPLDNYILKEYEVCVLTRCATADGQTKETPKKTYFTPVWHDRLMSLDSWFLPEAETSDWQATAEGMKGQLRLDDSGNLLKLLKDVPWGPIALGFDVVTLNDGFANVVIRFRDYYRIIIGDGDLATIRAQRNERTRTGKGMSWVPLDVDAPSYPLNVKIGPEQWLRVIVHFYPEFEPETSRFLIEVLHPKNNPFFLKPIEVLFPREKITESWHDIRIGHLNPTPKSKYYPECSTVIFAHFEIYGPLTRFLPHTPLHER